MTTIAFPTHAPISSGAKPGLVSRIVATVNEWSRRSEGRAALARMSPAELRDIGLSAGEAEFEVNKAPWHA